MERKAKNENSAGEAKESFTYPLFFNPEDLGASLKEVSKELIYTTHHEVVNRWFHSNKDTDLYIWCDSANKIIKQQLSFYGQVVEWNAVEGVRTGLIIEDASGAKAGHKGSELIRFDQVAQKGPIAQAMKLLGHVVVLSAEERLALCGNFSEEVRNARIAPEEFSEKFGALMGHGKAKKAQTSWWTRAMAALSLWLKE
jgi:hypothetical protein